MGERPQGGVLRLDEPLDFTSFLPANENFYFPGAAYFPAQGMLLLWPFGWTADLIAGRSSDKMGFFCIFPPLPFRATRSGSVSWGFLPKEQRGRFSGVFLFPEEGNFPVFPFFIFFFSLGELEFDHFLPSRFPFCLSAFGELLIHFCSVLRCSPSGCSLAVRMLHPNLSPQRSGKCCDLGLRTSVVFPFYGGATSLSVP